MSATAIQRDGRKWTVDENGISPLVRRYRVVLDTDNLPADGETISFDGVPAIGSAHPNHSGLKVVSYEVTEGEANEKKVLDIDVKYDRPNSQSEISEDEEEEDITLDVEQWGWESGLDERELVMGVDGTPVLNSAGDVFESLPNVSVPAPVFTKVVKSATRQTFAAYICCVNSGSVTIGNVTCPARTLLCQVSEQRIFGDANWKYRYTIQLRYRSNKVKVNGGNSLTEIGWAVAVVDAGMREKDSTTGKLVLIKQMNPETGTPSTISTPELLDGQGHAVTRSAGSTPTPYNIPFDPYPLVSFPSWFYSEPT